MQDWTDLGYLVAVARHGSTTAAAKALGVNQSTVQRRLAELERHLGRRLVERLPTGYRLTAEGEALLPYAEGVASAVAAFEARAVELGRVAGGVVRLTCPEPIALRLTRSGYLDLFHAEHPDLRVELVLADRYIDLTKGEADVALRSGDTDDGVLVGRKVADSLWAVYASADYAAAHAMPADVAGLKDHPLGAFDESVGRHRLTEWLAEVAPGARIVARATSVLGLVQAAKSGVGLVALPMALGDAEPDLVRILGPVPELTRAWRLLAHPAQR